MKKYKVTLTFVLDDNPRAEENATNFLVQEYIKEALIHWNGCFHPANPFFGSVLINNVKVKLYAKSTKRK